ncbi:cob(I)yrinic acid a,c-diamide adenosyltransferase [Candidatus Kaiserbacteria bacterium]|nr:cob(I)yrinic acid a,c-diamide adenosyltransferase [Candidatus Kaiserbacteria bacterium]
MLIIFTGNGKGKTTASLGQALRTIGDGKKVLMVQFIKGPWKSGEDTSQEKLWPEFRIVKKGLGFVGIGDDRIPFEDHAKAAHEAMDYALRMVTQEKPDMIILDEAINALDLKLIEESDVNYFLEYARSRVENIILTGRNCPEWLIETADLVTEMKEIKHPFARGVRGSKGVEF